MTMLKKKWLVECNGLEMWFETKWAARNCLLRMQAEGLSPGWFHRV